MRALVLFAISAILLISCSKKPNSAYEVKLIKHRTETDIYMKNDPNSPFNKKSKVEFHPLNYFDADTNFIYKSKLTEFAEKDTIEIYGTKGEPRKTVRYGYFTLNHNGKQHKLKVYESNYNGTLYYSLWFTDNTTNKETYGVGRYLELELNNDPEHVYTIDFNYAFNPYCAYSHDYSCAVPTKDDHLDIEIRAGEMKFHD